MKKAKIIFASLILCLLTLSVMGKNNVNLTFDLFGFDDEENTVSEKEIREFVGKELVDPIKACYVEANPDAFMTKCPSEFLFNFDKPHWAGADYKPTYYKGQPVQGELVFLDCTVEQHICKAQVNVSKNEIKVQESFFSDWVTAKDFNKTFCERVKKKD